LRRATADRGGSDKPLKRLERNFQADTAMSATNPNLYPLASHMFITLNLQSLITKKNHVAQSIHLTSYSKNDIIIA